MGLVIVSSGDLQIGYSFTIIDPLSSVTTLQNIRYT